MYSEEFNKFLTEESAASLIEYSLLTGLVSLTILLAISAISGSLGQTWSSLASMISQAAGG